MGNIKRGTDRKRDCKRGTMNERDKQTGYNGTECEGGER
jgi:hypothetical protein